MSKFLKNINTSIKKVKEKENDFKKLLDNNNFKILEIKTTGNDVSIVGESFLYKDHEFGEKYHKKVVTNSMIFLGYHAKEKTYNINIRTYYKDKNGENGHVALYEYGKNLKEVFKKASQNFYKDFKSKKV